MNSFSYGSVFLEPTIDKKTDVFDLEAVKIRDGDIKAFERLYRFHCQTLIRFACQYVHDVSEAENIVQDVFLSLWENRSRIDPSRKLKTYIYTAVRNKALKALARKQTQKKHQDGQKHEQIPVKQPDTLLEEEELKRDLNLAIDALPNRCREIFLMNRHDKLTYREIAGILDISIKTVETHMGRALKFLRRRLLHLKVVSIL